MDDPLMFAGKIAKWIVLGPIIAAVSALALFVLYMLVHGLLYILPLTVLIAGGAMFLISLNGQDVSKKASAVSALISIVCFFVGIGLVLSPAVNIGTIDLPMEFSGNFSDQDFKVQVYEDQWNKCYAEGGGYYSQKRAHTVYCYDISNLSAPVCWYRVLSSDDFGGNSAAMYYNCAR